MKLVKNILKGIFMGIANIIPGVSGGTMAVSMGIYDEIIFAVTHLFSQFRKSVKTLLPYFIGMVIGLVGLSQIIEILLDRYNMATNFLFIGLILGGIRAISSRLKGKKIDVGCVLCFFIFFALIIGLQFFKGQNATSVQLSTQPIQLLLVFIIGIIASATMVIPGVSGSMILMILGYYEPILEYINGFVRALSKGDWVTLFEKARILVPFGLGVVIGIFAIAKLIEVLLRRWETLTFSGILGLVAASPIAVLMNARIPALGVGNIAVSILTFAIGFFIAYRLGRE